MNNDRQKWMCAKNPYVIMRVLLSFNTTLAIAFCIAIMIVAIMAPEIVLSQSEDYDAPPITAPSPVDAPQSAQAVDAQPFSIYHLLDPENAEENSPETLSPPAVLDPQKNTEQSHRPDQPQLDASLARLDSYDALIACSDYGDLNWTTTSSSSQVIKECTLNVPNDGWLFISSTASVAMLDSAYQAAFNVGIDSTSAAAGVDREVDVYNNSDDGTDRTVALSLRTQVTAGTHTVYFFGRRTRDPGTVLLYDPTLSVIFLPNSNSPLLSCGEGNDVDWASTSEAFEIIRRCSLTIPAQGQVFISGDGWLTLSDEAYEMHLRVGVDSMAGLVAADRHQGVPADDNQDDGSISASILTSISPGTHNFYLLGRRFAGTGTISFIDSTLSVLYIPDSANILTTCGHADDAADWESNSSSFQVIRQCDFTMPADGWAYVSADGLNHPGNYELSFRIGIDQPAGSFDFSRWVNGLAEGTTAAVSGLQWIPAGTHTAYLAGARYSGSDPANFRDATLSVIASFADQTCYRLTRANTGSGSTPTASSSSSSGCNSGEYKAGTVISLNATPASGWAVDRWSGTDNNSSKSTSNSVTMPANDHTVTVHYTPICYRLTLSHTGSGSDPVPSPSQSDGCGYNEFIVGEPISLTATPVSGWEVDRWSGTDNDNSNSNSNSVTMPANDHTVTVYYRAICYQLTRTHTGSGSNPNVSPSSSSGCNSGEYKAGTVISLNAAAASGWEVDRWSGTDNDSSTSRSNSLTMPANDHTVTVHYRAICYLLARIHSGNGSNPTASPSNSSGCSSGRYHAGETISLRADPDNGWKVDRWSGTDNNASNSDINSVTMPAASRAVQVYYVPTTQYVHLPVIRRDPPPPPFPELANGAFDAGITSWSQTSGAGLPLIVNETDIPASHNVHAHSSPWLAWLGGRDNEIADLSQSFTIPAQYDNLKLHFYYWIGVEEGTTCGGDMAWVRINAGNLWNEQLCEDSETPGWQALEHNLAGYAGQTVTLHFHLELNDDNHNSNWFIDTVTLCDDTSSLHPCP